MGDYTSSVDQRNNQALGFGATADSANSLADFLRQKQQFQQSQQQPFELAKQKAQLGQEEQERNVNVAQGIIDNQAKSGRNVHAKIGDVAINQQEDSPLKYLLGTQQKGAHALSHAYDTYMKAFPDVQKRAQSAQEGLEAINDPNQVGSVGQAKTLMIKNLGMNRYNQQEGDALVPPQAGSFIHQIFNYAGDGNNPLTPSQRQALNTVFKGSLHIAKKQHDMAKQNALGSYAQSGFYDPVQGEKFKNEVGAKFDKDLGDTEQKYNSVPQTAGYQQNAPPQPSMLDKLKGLFTSGASAQAQSQGSQESPEQELTRLKAKHGR